MSASNISIVKGLMLVSSFFVFLFSPVGIMAVDETTVEELVPNEFQGGGVDQNWNGDDAEWNYSLPFTFNFYGVDYTDIKISSNGYICLDDSKDCTDYYPSLDNDYLGPIISPMGTDLRTDENPTSDIYIAENSDNVVIRWDAVEWGETNQINFEAVLYADGNIKFNYGEQIVSLLTGAAVGISKGDGSTYTESVYNGGVDFDMVDTSAWGVFGPNLISLSPHNGSIGINPSSDLIIAFDRNVYAGSGEITVRKYEDDSVVEAIDVISGNVGGLGGDVVAVNPEADLISGVKYYILISSGAFKDGSDADYSGIGDKNTWSFTIMPDGNDFAFTDDFSTASHKDAGETTTNWNISEGTIRLPSFGNNWTNADEINSDRDIISTKADYSRGESAPVIAHDSDGNPMIAWTEWIQAESRSEIYFTRWNGSEWVNMDGITAGSEDVSDRGNHNYYPRMEIDSNDYPHIIWHDIVDDEIYYTRWDGSDWVDAGGNPGNEKISGTTLTYYVYTHVADLKLDSYGRPNILWRANSVNGEDFYFTRWNGSRWVQMDGTTPGYGLATTNGEVALWALPFSFLLDEDDRPHISWVNNYVYYTGWNGSAWTYADDATLGAETVSSSLKTGDFMRLDSGQNPVIMYSDNNYVYFTKYVPGNGWVQSDGETSGEEAVAADGEYPNFYLDSEDNVYATWINFNNADQIYFSKSVGGSWQNMDGDPGFDKISSDRASTGAIWYQNLKILSDSNGYPNVAWLQDEGNFQQPMFVRWNGSAWTAGDGITPGSEAIWLSSYDMYDIDFVIGPDDTLMFIWWRDSLSTYYVYYFQHNPPDHYSPRIAQSIKLNGDIQGINKATLIADDETPGESSITYYLSNNGGENWDEVEPGEEIIFSSAGNDLRWRAVLNKGSSPVINSISVLFSNVDESGGDDGNDDGDGENSEEEGSEESDEDEDDEYINLKSSKDGKLIFDVKIPKDTKVKSDSIKDSKDESTEIKNVSIKTKKDEKIDGELTIKDKKEKPEDVVFPEEVDQCTPYQILDIDAEFSDKDIKKAELTFRVPKGWLKKYDRETMTFVIGKKAANEKMLEKNKWAIVLSSSLVKTKDGYDIYEVESESLDGYWGVYGCGGGAGEDRENSDNNNNNDNNIDDKSQKKKDIDRDGNDEIAIDQNGDISDGNTDGYEEFSDPDGSSDDIYKIDGDQDGQTDFLIDTDGDGSADAYWDPDDGIATDTGIEEVDGKTVIAIDTDGDGEFDSYYYPIRDEIREIIDVQSSEKDDIISSNTVRTSDDKMNGIIKNEETISAVSIIGLITGAGAVMASAGGAIPLVPFVPNNLNSSFFYRMLSAFKRRRFFSIFQLIPFSTATSREKIAFPFDRKGEDPAWGIVFDSYTKLPVPDALVQLVDKDRGKMVEQVITDKEGRYGFLIKKGGEYVLKIKKGEYEIKSDAGKDSLYGKIYSDPISLKEGEVAKINVALEAKGFNWDAFSENMLKRYHSFFLRSFSYFLDTVYILGFLFSIYAVMNYPNLINYIILILYIGLLAYKLVKYYSAKKFGTIIGKESGRPLPFAVIELYDKITKQRLNFTVSDLLGRYYLLADNGEYIIRIKYSSNSEDFEGEDKIIIKDGIFKKDLVV